MMDDGRGVAIIGMACRFPGAATIGQFWNNLRAGVESITFFTDDQLIAAGIDPAVLQHPAYVRAAPILEQVDAFDAAFFGYSPKEAAIMDPQHRVFLEVCWEAFEDAGYDPLRHDNQSVGVFAGAGSAMTSYLFAHSRHPEMQGHTAGLQHINTDKDFLATRVSYKLDLTGPSLTVQTACSTSLVAVHLACQSVLNGECDLALAGASTIRVPHISGYLAERGSVHSTDGHCRAFDAGATGTIFGSGVACVLLKSVSAALADRDVIYAVIKGTAVSNDGAAKVSYTSASVNGQARAMAEAMAIAGVEPDTIDLVECHATGTAAGDPIEVQALRRVFGGARPRSCALGSVKTNIGHPEQTAGMAGLIKAALSLANGAIPPNLHFATPNPKIPFATTPFYVPTQLVAWPRSDKPRRAGVNSLGIGGTNAFAVLEEPPHRPVSDAASAWPSDRERLFCVSARTDSALRRQAEGFAGHLERHASADLGDVCHTVGISRTGMPHRLAIVSGSVQELVVKLSKAAAADTTLVPPAAASPPRIAMLFPGQGSHHAGMAAELYRVAPVFRDALQQCDARLERQLEPRLIDGLFGADAERLLDRTDFAQPALFAVEYALSALWRSWGVEPTAVLGHSVGEYVAACVAGVLDVGDAMTLVAERGRLMQRLGASGAMAAVFADEGTVQRALADAGGQLTIAAVNTAHNVVVSGDRAAVDRLRRRLDAAGVASRPLRVSHAFHSGLVDPVLPDLERAAAAATARPPRIHFISNLSGRPHEAAPGPRYWSDHARKTVRFLDGMRALDDLGYRVFVEAGPGTTLSVLGRDCVAASRTVFVSSMPRAQREWAHILDGLGRLFVEGCAIDFARVNADGPRGRVALPTYPFERKRFWLAPAAPTSSPESQSTPAPVAAPEGALPAVYQTRWIETPAALTRGSVTSRRWVLWSDGSALGRAIASALARAGHAVHVVQIGADAKRRSRQGRIVDGTNARQVERALGDLAAGAPALSGCIYLGSRTRLANDADLRRLIQAESAVLQPLVHLARAIATGAECRGARLWIVTRGAHRAVDTDESVDPIQTMLWGFGRSLALETPNQWGGLIDVPTGVQTSADVNAVVEQLLSAGEEPEIAIRHARRYVVQLEPLTMDTNVGAPIRVRPDRVYMVTGGLGLVGMEIAQWLVERQGARHLVLVSRSQPTSEARRRIAALETRTVRVDVVNADVTLAADVGRLCDAIDATGLELGGVVHCAGALADGIVARMAWERFTSATAAKMRGAWNLHQRTKGRSLDFFIVQSSLLSLTGSAGQSNYTAANAFLDGLIAHRTRRGLAGMAINWGPWAGGGMATTGGARGEVGWRNRGMTLLSAAAVHSTLDRLFERPVAHTAVAICDWTRFRRVMPTRSHLLDPLAGSSTPNASPVSEDEEPPSRSLRDRMLAVPADRQRDVLLAVLAEEVRRELGFDSDVSVSVPLPQLGVDSLMAANLANRLEETLAITIPLARMLRHPTIEQMADDMMPSIGAAPGRDAAAGSPAQSAGAPRSTAGRTRVDGFLVRPSPNDAARIRLFCFNYAGGGAATFFPWAPLLAPWIELVAIEPPGRGYRPTDAPAVSLGTWLDRLLPQMQPYFDRPCAFLGHCLGALTAFEMARRLVNRSDVELVHLFVSGARPPHLIQEKGPFEEASLARLLADERYDPLRPIHEQPDATFATAIRHFNIGATDEFLRRPELRALLLPAVRADFRMVADYRFTPTDAWAVPITCFNGLADAYVTRAHALEWGRYTSSEFRLHLRRGNHFLVVEDREFIVSAVNGSLEAAREPASAPQFV